MNAGIPDGKGLAHLKSVCSLLVCLVLSFGLFSCSSDGTGPKLPRLILSETAWSLNTWYNGNTQTLTDSISVEGGLRVRFTVTNPASWLTVTATDSVTPAELFLQPNSLNLPRGEHTALVSIRAEGVSNSPTILTVTLTIGSSLELTPTVLRFTGVKLKDSNQTEAFDIDDGSGGTIPITITGETNWLDVELNGDSTPATAQVHALFDQASLPTGTFAQELTISSDSVLNSPQKVVCSLTVYPWYQQSVTFPLNLGDMKFVSDQVGYMLAHTSSAPSGSAGYVFTTTDGGEHWSDSGFFRNYRLSGIDFYDSQNGWVVGDSGHVLRTVNGGSSWDEQTLDSTIDMTGVDFVNALTGWCVGEGGHIYHSIDGGDTWSPQTSNSVKDIHAVQFLTTNVGFACASTGVFFYTNDGGTTWDTVKVSPADLRSVFFQTTLHGWVVGDDGNVWETLNGGASWTAIDIGGATQLQLKRIFFTDDPAYGWAVGNNGAVYGTSDFGDTWTRQFITGNAATTFFGLTARSSELVWVAGSQGTILHSRCGGR
jgi:photosystem II stability/assembly factor-like uncharacterized protein